MSSIYDFKIKGLKGRTEIVFEDHKGKYMMLVNLASQCGYTPQYEDLQTIHEQYGDQLMVIGFPSNDFGGQEPGTDEEIEEFCKINYAVSFPVSTKISIIGADQHPIYTWLAAESQAPDWNFCKYLINPEGKLEKFYPSAVNPGEILVDVKDLA